MAEGSYYLMCSYDPDVNFKTIVGVIFQTRTMGDGEGRLIVSPSDFIVTDVNERRGLVKLMNLISLGNGFARAVIREAKRGHYCFEVPLDNVQFVSR